jgi:hypothetical protein
MSKEKEVNILDNIASVVLNKRTRSLAFLVLTFFFILLANGLLPLISGQAHYTAKPVELTYGEYLVAKEENPLRDLTYGSKLDIALYKELYKIAHPNLTPEEIVLLEPPQHLKVSMFTVFFFESQWWYFETLLSLSSALLLFYALFNYLIIRSKETNTDYLTGEQTIKQLNEKYLDPDTFEPWMDLTFNRQRKRAQHIRNVKYKLKVLENKTPYDIRRKFKEYFKLKLEQGSSTNLPTLHITNDEKETLYLNQKEELLAQLEPDYIEESVLDGDVENCKEIKPGFVYSGINYEGVGQDEYSTIRTDSERIKKTVLFKLLISAAVTLGFASLLTVLAITVTKQAPLWVFMTVLMKLLPLLLQVYFAIDYNNWFMDNQLLPNLKFRENIAMLYLAEMRRRGVNTQNVVINKVYVAIKEKNKNKKISEDKQ